MKPSFSAYLLLTLALTGCATRPASVPKDAVYVSGAKTGWWQLCTYDKTRDVDVCQIYREDGNLIVEEEFLLFDGGAPVHDADLHIDGDSRFGSVNRVVLKNGKMLLRKSTFEAEKAIVTNSMATK
jgi:hypothetical protein